MTPAQNTEIKTISRHHPEFRLEAYASISPSELVVFAVQLLQADELTASVEDVVSICFRLFPHSFSLKNYFYWPDSALVMRRLHDAKDRGYLKGNAVDGFAAKVKGKQIAKRVAKVLGVSLPVPQKVEVPIPLVETKVEPEAPIKVEEVEKPVIQPVEVPAPLVEKKKPSAKKLVKTSSPKEKKEEREKHHPKILKEKVKPVSVKKAPKLVVKVQPVKKKQVKKIVSAPKPQLKEPAPKPRPVTVKKKNEKSSVKVKPQKTPPMQLTLALQPAATKKKAEVSASRPTLKNEAKQVKTQAATPAIIPVSKEEKEKAGKVVKQMERSDAYLMFKRNGRKAHISEFDFRNMLFATMESPAETLKRNVDTFKRYAGVHQRNDLIGFLDFCEQHFAALLIPKTKQPIKKLRFKN